MAAKQEVSLEEAEQVVALIKAKWPESAGWSHQDGPHLYPAEHEEMPEGCWSIAWEGAPEGWASEASGLNGRSLAPDGVFLEPMYSWCLGVYPA